MSYQNVIMVFEQIFNAVLNKIGKKYDFVVFFASTFCTYSQFIEEIQDYLVSSSYVEQLFMKKLQEHVNKNPSHELAFEISNKNKHILHQFIENISRDDELNSKFVNYIINIVTRLHIDSTKQTQNDNNQSLTSVFRSQIQSSMVQNQHDDSVYICIMESFNQLIVDAIVKTNLENVFEEISKNDLLVNTMIQPQIISKLSNYLYDNHINKQKLLLINDFTNDNQILLNNILETLKNMDPNFLRSEIKNSIKTLIDPTFQRSFKSTVLRASRAATNMVTNPLNNNILSLRKYVNELKPIVQELRYNLSFIDNANVQYTR